MTLDEKLEQFYNVTIESATTQNIEIVNEYKKMLDSMFEEHKKEVLKKAELSYRLETENLIREKNRSLSSESIAIKRRLQEKSQELIDTLFDDVLNRLTEYMKTNAYILLLENQILSAKSFAREDELTVYINPSDEDKKQVLETSTKVPLNISAYDFIGGTRAVIHAKNILIDHSFSSKLTGAKESFTLY